MLESLTKAKLPSQRRSNLVKRRLLASRIEAELITFGQHIRWSGSQTLSRYALDSRQITPVLGIFVAGDAPSRAMLLAAALGSPRRSLRFRMLLSFTFRKWQFI